jgi:hypothetical protein
MTREKKFTEAPWSVVERKSCISVKADHTSNPKWDVADVYDGTSGSRLANAHLIAAAPELLEALELAEAVDEDRHPFHDLECFVDDPETHSEYWDEYTRRRNQRMAIEIAYGETP